MAKCKFLIEKYDEYGFSPICSLNNKQCNYMAHIQIYGSGNLKACENFKEEK